MKVVLILLGLVIFAQGLQAPAYTDGEVEAEEQPTDNQAMLIPDREVEQEAEQEDMSAGEEVDMPRFQQVEEGQKQQWGFLKKIAGKAKSLLKKGADKVKGALGKLAKGALKGAGKLAKGAMKGAGKLLKGAGKLAKGAGKLAGKALKGAGKLAGGVAGAALGVAMAGAGAAANAAANGAQWMANNGGNGGNGGKWGNGGNNWGNGGRPRPPPRPQNKRPLPPPRKRMPEDVEDCVACRYVWLQVEMDVGNSQIEENIYDSFYQNCLEAQKAPIFYPACQTMFDSIDDMIGDYMDGFSVNQLCENSMLCR